MIRGPALAVLIPSRWRTDFEDMRGTMTTEPPSPQSAAPPGWYPDPTAPGQLRYWDGYAWGNGAPAAPPPAAAASSTSTSTKAIIGFVLSLASWAVCPVIAAIPALIMARLSAREIAAAQGRLTGDGFNLATRIIAWVNIGFTLLAAIVIAILIAFGAIFTASVVSDLDPTINERTGLADGRYVIDPSTRVNLNSVCSYGGAAFTLDGDELPFTSVYGKGPLQCPDLVQVSAVEIEVTDGVATIVDVR